MAQTTIQWTSRPQYDGRITAGYTFNIVWGCTKVSEGCKFCYADTLATRYGYQVWGPRAPRRTFSEQHWQQPLAWNRDAARRGYRYRVFCSSMADTFEDHPTTNQEREKLWPLIEQTPSLDWLLLTKRPHNILDMVPWPECFPANVWVGTSVELQQRAEERLPYLLAVPAIVRFLSCEPLLGPLDLGAWLDLLQWVIVGGESGHKHRPMQGEWARSLRDQCVGAGVPFHFKQWGGSHHAAGGRILDGRTWDDLPPSCAWSNWPIKSTKEKKDA